MNSFDTDKWRMANDLLGQVLQLPEEEQTAAAEKLGTHSGVYKELHKLLAGIGIPSCLDESLDTVFDHIPTSSFKKHSLTGKKFDDWVLGEEIGRGGMSVVYQATRSGDGFEQTAAFKILSIAFLSQQHIESFIRERKILSDLTHPGIARMIDGGISTDGVPYLVMEQINGQRIDHWCSQKNTDQGGIVGLMEQLCRGVSHAHRHLVVHRDINPSNILVDQRGRPILVDFGIAKLLDEAETGKTLQAFTPEYAAPEQRLGETITTATDVYGLGATLERLLRDTKADQDLRSIVHVATHADADLRYATAKEMGNDLQAWLDGRPVLARPDSFGYRLRKYTRRNWRWLSVAGLAIAIGIAGLISTRQQAEISRLEAAKHRAAADFMLGIFKQADLMSSGADLRVTELLETAGKRAKTELAEQPEALVSLLTLIASGQLELTNYASATEMLDSAQTLISQTNISPAVQSEYFLERGREFYEQGKFSSAVEQLRISLELLTSDGLDERQFNDRYFLVAATLASFLVDAEQYEQSLTLAASLIQQATQHGASLEAMTSVTHRYAVALEVTGSTEEAFEQYAEALRLQQEYQPDNLLGRAEILGDYGIALYFTDRFIQAEAVFKEVLQIFSQKLAPLHPRIASTTHNLAFALAGQEKLQEAIEILEESYRMTVQLHGTEHIDSLLEQATLGTLLARNADYDRAELIFRDNINVLDRVAPDMLIQRGVIHSYLGDVLLQTRRLQESRAEYLIVLELLSELPDDNVRVVEAHTSLEEIDAGIANSD